MYSEYIQYLSGLIPEKDSLKLVKLEAEKYYKSNTIENSYTAALEFYQSDNFQIQEVGVLLLGYVAHQNKEAIDFLKSVVSKNGNWKVQEVLAMAFDNHCKNIGYKNALPIIKEWFSDDRANVRRAVPEGLRIWTSRPYFKGIQILQLSYWQVNGTMKANIAESLSEMLSETSAGDFLTW